MSTYIGTKIIEARPMPAPLGHVYEGAPGYEVTYPDKYVSWSPEAVFEESYRRTEGIPYSVALEGLLRGQRWTRIGWNGPHQYIHAQFPDEHSKMTDPYLYIHTTQGGMIPWLCSQGDAFANDWVRIYDV